ncbi:MAG: hypothetical protein SCARUB_00250 [Candidatus Scalindua rubra]|uniref:Cobalt-precorrin-6A synthase n=1 Tax=Candidatus Scalindua rubra TaxID=1872076 RepID=A0A1E3XGC5_9BACT|nr:MAG: hypothetical protein SCARUB_00250 [Candidatus Scalindua rubra]
MKHKYGYTTGSCAAGAAKGAALGILKGTIPEFVTINTPINTTLRLRLIHSKVGLNYAECSIRKYSGDDPDVTNGCEVHVRVKRSENACPNDSFPPKRSQITRQAGIRFIGGEGVGIVTRPGLQVKQGEPAINPVPRAMIKDAIKEVLGDYDGISVTITVPEGKKLAKKTFNERLGIIGGISIIGTTGIVRPMSLDLFKVSLLCGLDVAKASGYETIVLVPGSVGEKGFLRRF